MANTQKTKADNKKETGGKRVVATQSVHNMASPFRREALGAISFFLGLFIIFGFFSQEAFFIRGFTLFLKGMVGVGFWLYSPMFFLASYVLMCHRGRPVIFRVCCALLLPISYSSFCFGFIRKDNRPSLTDIANLWDTGQATEGCGVLGSWLGGGATFCFTAVGSVLIFFVCTFLLSLAACNRSIMDIIDWFAQRPLYQYPAPTMPQFPKRPKFKVPKKNRDTAEEEDYTPYKKTKAKQQEEEDFDMVEELFHTRQKIQSKTAKQKTFEPQNELEHELEDEPEHEPEYEPEEKMEFPVYKSKTPSFEEDETPYAPLAEEDYEEYRDIESSTGSFQKRKPFHFPKRQSSEPVPIVEPLKFPEKAKRAEEGKEPPVPQQVQRGPRKKIESDVFSAWEDVKDVKMAPASKNVPDPLQHPERSIERNNNAVEELKSPTDSSYFNKKKSVPTPDQVIMGVIPQEEPSPDAIVELPATEFPTPESKPLSSIDIKIADDPSMRTVPPKVDTTQEEEILKPDATKGFQFQHTQKLPTQSFKKSTDTAPPPLPKPMPDPIIKMPSGFTSSKPVATETTAPPPTEPVSTPQKAEPVSKPTPPLPIQEVVILDTPPVAKAPYHNATAPTAPPTAQPIHTHPTAPTTAPTQSAQSTHSAQATQSDVPKKENNYVHPPLSLLRQGSYTDSSAQEEELSANRLRLEDTLKSFSINASIHNVTQGPSVTRYEVMLEQGVKLNKLTNLSDDIALALGATGVRIAPIPDKISMVGIEVPNRNVTAVEISTVIGSANFLNSQSKVSFAVGKDIAGNAIVGNIGKMPHLLVAGTTGSGKSVCTNSLIISLLYKASPEEVRLIMVDPKMVELQIYNGIPHLLIPVVTDPKKAAGALQWAVSEMMKRYRLFSDVGTRDLASYNELAETREDMEKMPQVVVVIDELADLMLVAAKEVEESICRVAQMGRASGMHLIVATQRPSADVITGLMKANIPSRISFAVSSGMESRIILDTQGAEKLVGRGDMLYAPLGEGKPARVQGCLITDPEVAAVVDFVKRENSLASYSDEIMEEIDQNVAAKEKNNKNSNAQASFDDDSQDEMLDDAIEVVLELKQASTSMLQRRLKLGYARAARIVDQMEDLGVVGASEGSKPRQILISKEQWQELKYRRGSPQTQQAPSETTETDHSPPW